MGNHRFGSILEKETTMVPYCFRLSPFTSALQAGMFICQYVFTSHSACPAPFTEQDGSCFYVSTEYVNWTMAKTGCENICGHLVMIKTDDQQQKVVNFLDGYSKRLYYDMLGIWRLPAFHLPATTVNKDLGHL